MELEKTAEDSIVWPFKPAALPQQPSTSTSSQHVADAVQRSTPISASRLGYPKQSPSPAQAIQPLPTFNTGWVSRYSTSSPEPRTGRAEVGPGLCYVSEEKDLSPGSEPGWGLEVAFKAAFLRAEPWANVVFSQYGFPAATDAEAALTQDTPGWELRAGQMNVELVLTTTEGSYQFSDQSGVVQVNEWFHVYLTALRIDSTTSQYSLYINGDHAGLKYAEGDACISIVNQLKSNQKRTMILFF